MSQVTYAGDSVPNNWQKRESDMPEFVKSARAVELAGREVTELDQMIENGIQTLEAGQLAESLGIARECKRLFPDWELLEPGEGSCGDFRGITDAIRKGLCYVTQLVKVHAHYQCRIRVGPMEHEEIIADALDSLRLSTGIGLFVARADVTQFPGGLTRSTADQELSLFSTREMVVPLGQELPVSCEIMVSVASCGVVLMRTTLSVKGHDLSDG